MDGAKQVAVPTAWSDGVKAFTHRLLSLAHLSTIDLPPPELVRCAAAALGRQDPRGWIRHLAYAARRLMDTECSPP